MHRLRQRSNEAVEKVAVKTTHWIGSTGSLIVHTFLFIGAFVLYFFDVPIGDILLVLTTIVSLEAIYLSIFIQMSVNRQYQKLHAVAEDVEDIQEDVDDIQKDIDEIQEDVEDIQEEDEAEEKEDEKDDEILSRIENTMGKLIEEVIELKKQQVENKIKK